jgi:hypothetical protein
MQKKCDLYLSESTRSPEFRYLKIYDQEFVYEEQKEYSGYLKINVDRIKLLVIISELSKKGITAYSVPVNYRDSKNITREEALVFAQKYAESLGRRIVRELENTQIGPPLFWQFNLNGGEFNEKAGGIVMIDRIDGHSWDLNEYEEYMHDFNNILPR